MELDKKYFMLGNTISTSKVLKIDKDNKFEEKQYLYFLKNYKIFLYTIAITDAMLKKVSADDSSFILMSSTEKEIHEVSKFMMIMTETYEQNTSINPNELSSLGFVICRYYCDITETHMKDCFTLAICCEELVKNYKRIYNDIMDDIEDSHLN